ncbi:DUF268 domain-containing protein [Haloferula sp. A504]|uniref:DUF268 domain-containing protein n=1 Tax=Haloferula sp. A504 TaxID=3373601 RepID=UPI0031C6F31D|nr:DUF268 domain-containing protein [Verrucomicrobiaceae bacterium E54]
MLRAILRNAGFDPRRLVSAWRGWRRYVRDRRSFRSAQGAGAWKWGRELPMLTEWEEQAGSLGAYFHQDLTVARWVREAEPQRHVDVGSRIDGFIGHLAVFREVEVLDIRPLNEAIPGVLFHQLDLMEPLPAEWVASTDSLSCLHTIEHFGLGRYGDAIDPTGHDQGLQALKSMVRQGGRLYLSTPIGDERIEFNAHRVFAPSTVAGWFDTGWEIEKSAILDERNRLEESVGAEALLGYSGKTGLGMVVARKESGSLVGSTS